MLSATTNVSAMTATRLLGEADRSLATVMKRVSTGLKVAGAIDDASSFSIAQGVRSDLKAHSAIQQSLRTLSGTIGVAAAGASGILEQITLLKQRSVELDAADPDGKAIVQSDINAILGQIDLLAEAATFNGTNLINATQDDLSSVAPADEGTPFTINGVGSQSHTIGTTAGTLSISFTTSGSGGGQFRLVYDGATVDSIGLGGTSSGTLTFAFPGTPSDSITLQRVGAPAKDVTYSFEFSPSVDFGVEGELKALSDIDGDYIDVISYSLKSGDLGLDTIDYTDTAGAIAALDGVEQTVLEYLGYLGAKSRSVEQALGRSEDLVDALSIGLGNIVDADLARDSAILNAAQVKSSLSTQTLAIANQSPNALLGLFGR